MCLPATGDERHETRHLFVADPAVEREEGCLSDHRRSRQIVAQHVSDESPHYWGAAPAPVPQSEGNPHAVCRCCDTGSAPDTAVLRLGRGHHNKPVRILAAKPLVYDDGTFGGSCTGTTSITMLPTDSLAASTSHS